MRRECVIFISVCLTLFLVLGWPSNLFRDRYAYSQLIQDNSSVSQQQRIGTTNILDPPDAVQILYGDHMNSSLDEQFIVLGNNTQGTNTGPQNIAVSNPNYGLSTPVPILMIGGNFNINSSNDADIAYTSAIVKLVPITSPFPPSGMSIEDVDPENDISLGTPITIGNYTGNLGTFVIPHTATPGYYILYVYFTYPAENITAIYNAAVQLKG